MGPVMCMSCISVYVHTHSPTREMQTTYLRKYPMGPEIHQHTRHTPTYVNTTYPSESRGSTIPGLCGYVVHQIREVH